MSIRFALLTDLHTEALYDVDERLEKVMNRLNNETYDFILNLGDLCPPDDSNKDIMNQFNSLEIEMYYTLGNHDVEHWEKKTLLDFYNIKNDYYSFVKNDVKIIVLNSNYMKVEGQYSIYNRTIFKKHGGLYPVINPTQMEWLKQELNTTCTKIVIASHHSLENTFSNRGVINREEVQALLTEVRKEKDLVVCFNGHDHAESVEVINDVYYIGMNSMSYKWIGDKVRKHPLLEPYYNDYPELNFVLLYKDPLFSFIEIKDSGEFHIEGMKSRYLTDAPSDIGVKTWNGRNIKPYISTNTYNIKKTETL